MKNNHDYLNHLLKVRLKYFLFLRFIRFSIEYSNFNFDKDTLTAIKVNLNGITKLSKERIYNELNKILILKNFEEIHKNKDFLHIFKLVFPELKYLDRTKNFSIIRNYNSFKIRNIIHPIRC